MQHDAVSRFFTIKSINAAWRCITVLYFSKTCSCSSFVQVLVNRPDCSRRQTWIQCMCLCNLMKDELEALWYSWCICMLRVVKTWHQHTFITFLVSSSQLPVSELLKDISISVVLCKCYGGSSTAMHAVNFLAKAPHSSIFYARTSKRGWIVSKNGVPADVDLWHISLHRTCEHNGTINGRHFCDVHIAWQTITATLCTAPFPF